MNSTMYLILAGARGLDTAHPAFSLTERGARHHRFSRAGEEPTLRDLLTDPLTHAVMARDNVSANHLSAVLSDARARLRAQQRAQGQSRPAAA